MSDDNLETGRKGWDTGREMFEEDNDVHFEPFHFQQKSISCVARLTNCLKCKTETLDDIY